MPVQEEAVKSGKDEAVERLQAELQRLNAELADISSKLNTSQQQLEQLSQRNAAIAGEMRRLDGALEATPRVTLKETYTEAMNVQQRLLTLRGQIERLQSEQQAAQRSYDMAEALLDLLSRRDPKADELINARETIIRIIDAQEEERERLARAMHDGPAHALTNFILQTEICLKWFEKNPERAREELVKLRASANEAFGLVRAFIFDLRPMMLGDLGLVPTLRRYVSELQSKTDFKADLEIMGREMRLAEYLEVLLFRGITSLISNARDQRGATSAQITLTMGDNTIRVMVEDNGRGLGTGKLQLDSSNSEALGMGALQERLRLVGGTLQVESGSGAGTRVTIEVPTDLTS